MSSSPTPDFGVVAEVYDDVRPADAQWQEVFELLVEEGGLGDGGACSTSAAEPDGS